MKRLHSAAPRLAAVAHSLKGAVGVFHALQAQDAAQRVESAARASDTERACRDAPSGRRTQYAATALRAAK